MTLDRRLVRVELVSRTTADSSSAGGAFLELHHLKLRNHYNDGTTSDVYSYDAVLRPHLDAVVIAPFTSRYGELEVLLRSCLRPPIILRPELAVPFEESECSPIVWELPAGLLEQNDRGFEGIQTRAAMEMLEETGYEVQPSSIRLLPGRPFLSPGIIPERLYFAAVEIPEPQNRVTPKGDGSPSEDGAEFRWHPLKEALKMANRGELEDVKTELGIRKLDSLMTQKG